MSDQIKITCNIFQFLNLGYLGRFVDGTGTKVTNLLIIIIIVIVVIIFAIILVILIKLHQVLAQNMSLTSTFLGSFFLGLQKF